MVGFCSLLRIIQSRIRPLRTTRRLSQWRALYTVDRRPHGLMVGRLGGIYRVTLARDISLLRSIELVQLGTSLCLSFPLSNVHTVSLCVCVEDCADELTFRVGLRIERRFGQEFCDAIQNEWGGKPFRDLVAGVQYVKKAYPEIDGERMAALGVSPSTFFSSFPLRGMVLTSLFCPY